MSLIGTVFKKVLDRQLHFWQIDLIDERKGNGLDEKAKKAGLTYDEGAFLSGSTSHFPKSTVQTKPSDFLIEPWIGDLMKSPRYKQAKGLEFEEFKILLPHKQGNGTLSDYGGLILAKVSIAPYPFEVKWVFPDRNNGCIFIFDQTSWNQITLQNLSNWMLPANHLGVYLRAFFSILEYLLLNHWNRLKFKIIDLMSGSSMMIQSENQLFSNHPKYAHFKLFPFSRRGFSNVQQDQFLWQPKIKILRWVTHFWTDLKRILKLLVLIGSLILTIIFVQGTKMIRGNQIFRL